MAACLLTTLTHKTKGVNLQSQNIIMFFVLFFRIKGASELKLVIWILEHLLNILNE